MLVAGCYRDDQFLVDGVPCVGGMIAARLGAGGTPLWSTHVDGAAVVELAP